MSLKHVSLRVLLYIYTHVYTHNMMMPYIKGILGCIYKHIVIHPLTCIIVYIIWIIANTMNITNTQPLFLSLHDKLLAHPLTSDLDRGYICYIHLLAMVYHRLTFFMVTLLLPVRGNAKITFMKLIKHLKTYS